MNKNIATTNQNSKLALSKAKSLMNITSKILENKKEKEVVKSSKDISVSNEKVWRDPDTSLIWQVEIEDEKYTWEEAFEYADRLNSENYGGYSDWRVPTIDELKTILTEEPYENSKSYTGEIYIKKPLLDSMSMTKWQFFWSSTQSEYFSSKAWIVDFNYGRDRYYDISYTYYVRCVR